MMPKPNQIPEKRGPGGGYGGGVLRASAALTSSSLLNFVDQSLPRKFTRYGFPRLNMKIERRPEHNQMRKLAKRA